MGPNIDANLIKNILKNRESAEGFTENVLVATEYLNYQCREDELDMTRTVNNVQTKARKIIRMAVTMGDNTVSNMIVNIAERKGSQYDIINPRFEDCYEKF